MLRVAVGLGFRRARLQHVYSILRGKDLETSEFSDERRGRQFEVLEKAQAFALDFQHWHDFLKCLVRAGYRSGSMITSRVGIMYTYALFLVGKRDYEVEPFVLRDAIARWFFLAALTGRYTASPETVMEEDFARLREVRTASAFVATLDRIVADTVTEDYWNITLPNELATSAARSPTLFAYYAAQNLLEATALFSRLKISDLLDPGTRGTKSAVERHHLFPRAFLERQGVESRRDINQIANYAHVEWVDNIAISDEPPAMYYPKYAARFRPEEIRAMETWHALPEGWHRMDYRDFLAERRKLMAQVIRRGFERLADSANPEAVGVSVS